MGRAETAEKTCLMGPKNAEADDGRGRGNNKAWGNAAQL